MASCFNARARMGSVAASAATAPTTPLNLVATSSGNSVTLSWRAPSAGDPVTSYVIQAGSAPGLANLANFSTGSALTVFGASGVGAGTYYVRVRAANAAGTSAPSNEAVLVVGGSPGVPPGAPSGLTIIVNSGGTVGLAWNASSGSPTTYVIEAGSQPGLANLANSDLGSAATTLTATGVGAGTYYVRVRAKNAFGISAPSNEVQLVVGTTSTSLAGNWSGTTQQRKALTFTVNNANALTNLVVGFQITGSGRGGAGCIDYSFHISEITPTTPLAITNGSFTFSRTYNLVGTGMKAISVAGTFGSASTGSGTAILQWTGQIFEAPACSGTLNLTWSATKL